MLFNSFEFLLFFVIVTVLYFSLAQKFRWILLLAASYYFYMSWKAEYIVLLLFTTAVSYYMSILMENAENLKKRRFLLIISLIVNLGVLFFFKYFNFLNDTARDVLNTFSIDYQYEGLNILLPLGISFYTFQTIGYNLDVFYSVRKPERHFGIFALYVSFFPQLIAGPIERSQSLIPQFYEKHKINRTRIYQGLKLMLWGFFKKLVIADRLVPLVAEGFDNVNSYGGATILVSTFLFAIQLYADFSAYSEIAKGVAKILGYDLMDNFNHPFISKNITEFWRRWHISLSFWLRDYLYTPILFARKKWGKWAIVYALLITFLLVGIWHGTKITFVFLGLLQAFALIYEMFTKKWRQTIANKMPKFLYNGVSMAITFLYILYSFSFFRSNSLEDSILITQALFTSLFDINDLMVYISELDNIRFIFTISLTLLFLITDIWVFRQIKKENDTRFILYILYPLILGSILLFGYFGEVEFIYFKF